MKRLSDKIVELLNFRIKAELESSYLYEAMSVYLDFRGYSNAAKVWRKDAEGERGHAQWTIDYMLGMDIQPVIPTIDTIKIQDFKGIKELIDATVVHEDLVTKQCNELAIAAMLEKDLITHQFVSSKYLAEQIEELQKVLERQKYVELYANDNFAIESYFKEQLG